MLSNIEEYIDSSTLMRMSEFIVSSEFDFAVVILPEEDKFFFFDENAINPVLRSYLGKAYELTMQEVIAKFAAKELQTTLLHQFSLSNIREQLLKNKSFEFIGRGYLPSGEFTAKKHRMFYFHNDERYVLYTRTDITKEVKLYEEQNAALRKISQDAKKLKDKEITLLDALSHGIRTPMNGIYSSVQLLQEEKDHTKALQYLDIISDNTRRLQVAFSNLLSISDLSKNQFQFKPQKLNISLFVSEMVKEIQTCFEQTGHVLQFSCKLKSENMTVAGDTTQLRQVVMGLVDNAVKFSPKGSTITGSLEEMESIDPEIAHFKFKIEDEGCGMSAETLSHVFEPFYYAENSMTDKNRGLGLGLPLAKKMIEARGGTIDIQSELGKGTTITFNWYVKKECASSGVLEAVHEIDLCGIHILLVEDNNINIMIEKKLLEKANAAVTVAANGETGYDAFLLSADNEFDIILMDLKMPVMDGYESASLIRKCAHPKAKTIPIIAITANTMAEDIEKCYRVGINDYAPKPIDGKSLIAKIVSLCNSN